jgi:hypothetical protein
MNFTRSGISSLLMMGVLIVAVCAQQGKPLTNNDVIRMVQEEIDEDVIMRAIRTSDINFDVSPDGLIQLKKGKVKKHIIAAMQDLQLRRNNARAASNAANTKGIVSERDQPSVPLPTPMSKPSLVATETSAFYRFDLEKCSHSGMTVQCKFTITNLGEFRRLWIPLRTFNIIDNDGNQTRASGSMMGVKRDDEAEIPERVSINYSATFTEVPISATRISRLTMSFYPGNRQPRTQLVFKDIPLSR